MRNVICICFILVLGGCATHAQINMPVVQKVQSAMWLDKSINYQIYYSQPEPGIFSGGEQQSLKPIEEAKLSVASSTVLGNLHQLIQKQMPVNTLINPIDTPSDFTLKIELTAHDKLGPAYSDYEALASFGKSMLTMGLGSSEYNIVADFDVLYTLSNAQGDILYTKQYTVEDSVDHEKGQFESTNSNYEFAAQMLEKHLTLTLNSFLSEVSG